jgi:hypothetical protein
MSRSKKIKRHGVSLSGLVQRLNRHLDKEDHIVRAPRGRGPRKDGTFFIVDSRHNTVVAGGLTAAQLEKYARRNGVLQAWEEVKR